MPTEIFVRVFRTLAQDGATGFQYWCESSPVDDNWNNHADTVDQLARNVLSKLNQLNQSKFSGTVRIHFDPPASLIQQIIDGKSKNAGLRCIRLSQGEEDRFFEVYFGR